LLQLAFAEFRRQGRLDLEAIETATRAAMHRAGAAALQHLLQQPAESVPTTVPCPCGQTARYRQRRARHLLTVVGPLRFQRAYYCCAACHQGQSPRDRELDIVHTEYSPGVRRMMALVGSEASFDQGREQMALLAGIEVTRKAVERHAEAIGGAIERRDLAAVPRAVQLDLPEVAGCDIPLLYIEMDGTGVPVTAAETEGRPGKNGQRARTREVKLGCVFTQTALDSEGRPVRDEGSTTYTGAIEGAEEFGRRMYRHAWDRGWSRAKAKIILADGAVWIWNIADREFPGAIQIVDIYHARQHLWELAGKLFAADERQRNRWATKLQKKLDAGKIEPLVNQLRAFPAPSKDMAELLRIEAEYFDRNRERMRYPAFRRQGFFIGSGVIEAACRTVVAKRLKQSGMFWTVRAANAILSLRCCRLNREFEDFWATRAQAA
jgi:hypothetical protein